LPHPAGLTPFRASGRHARRPNFSFWPACEVPISLNNVCNWQKTGRHVLAVSLSRFDPNQK
jgi:hypothetical protein